MYKAISAHTSAPAKFEEKMVSGGHISQEASAAVKREWLASLNEAFISSDTCVPQDIVKGPRWKLLSSSTSYPVERATGVSIDTLYEVGVKSVAFDASVK
ncbi:hypothetical protein EV174_006876, partial [Coemansia sp. RSA 2320]